MISLLMFTSPSFNVLAEQLNEGEEVTEGSYSAKDEVIYGNLDATGKVNDIYVVNTFYIDKPGKLLDYGNYSNVRNLTNLSELDFDESGRIQFEADEKEFYYQGELKSKRLPWDISITYLLNGKKVKPENLAGESGTLEIQITTAENEQVDHSFFENYMLQISLTFDPIVFDSIQAPKGTEANVGRNKQFTFTVLPEREEELIVTAKVKDFEMEPISISAIPANIALDNIELGDIEGDMTSLSDAIRMVNDGVTALNDGISELNNGTTELSNGSSEYASGIRELSNSSGELVQGSKTINDALKQVSAAISGNMEAPDLSDLQALPAGLKELAGGLKEAASGLEQLKAGYEQAHGALKDAISRIPNGTLGEADILALYGTNADFDVINELVENYEAAQTVKGTYAYVQEGFDAVSGALTPTISGLRQMATEVEKTANGIEAGMDNMDELDGLVELQQGLSTLASEYETFHNGLKSYTDGVGMLATSYGQLDEGMKQLSEGTSVLSDGASELQRGTKELHEETSDLPSQMEEEVEKMLEEFANEDFEPISFVSDKNENVGIVQFVLQTDSIKIDEKEAEEEKVEEEQGFWELFLDLFR